MTKPGPLVSMPASFAQERLWFFDQLAPDTPLYNVHFGFLLHGPVDPSALTGALQALVARHEVLRTALRAAGGAVQQIISPQLAVPLPVVDLSDVPAEERVAEAVRRAAADAAEPFPLDQPPLLRSQLLRFHPELHAWLLTMHHAICDGWSAGVLFEELTEAYRAIQSDRPPDWPEVTLQYGDFAGWQRELVNDGLAEQRDYWTRQLAGAPPLLALPTDRPRPSSVSYRGALRELVLPPVLRAEVAALARRERVTEFMVLCGAFMALLHRWSGSTDLVVGTVVAGRDRVELERMVGFCGNTVPLRVQAPPRLRFRELLTRVRQTVADAQSHADLPFDQLVEAVRPDRQSGVNPLFQVMFDVQPGGHERLRLTGVRVEPLRVRDRRVSLFDLSLSVETSPDDLRLVAEYSTDLFDPETVDRFLASYQIGLERLVANPDQSIGEVPLLRPEQQAQLVARMDRTAAAEPAPPVTERIAGQVANRAEQLAVLDAGTGDRLSYQELWGQAGAVAAHLRGRGIEAGALVAVLAPKTTAAIAGILGILRSGAAYLPLDPAHPDARLSDLLRQARPAGLLAPASLIARAGQLAGSLAVWQLPESAAHESGNGAGIDAPPAPSVDPDELAYVMYTSGSTGQPKGVLVRHGGLANYVSAHQQRYRLTADDRVLQFTTLSFDVSAEEIFPCLAAGATLVLRSEELLDTPTDFLAGCDRLSVTVAHLPSAYFHELAAVVEAGAAPPPRTLRLLAIGGEAPSPPHVAAWHAAAPQVRIENVYGPTEATIVATMATLAGPGLAPPAGGSLPIGQPIPGAAAYVLDAELAPVPDGVVGELYLGGAGLAHGYHGRPDLTASRFVPNPFHLGGRLYRTGDLVRTLGSGELEFRGRTDDQVKVRGYRVELSEVTAALTALPEIQQAAVVPSQHPRGSTELAAYLVVADSPEPPSVAQLREQLAVRLPGYLVPAAFVILPALPLTATDKVDRAALPDPWLAAPGPGEPATEPAQSGSGSSRLSDEVLRIAAVWQNVLGVDRLDADADFFALGGHSLLASRVISQLRQEFGPAVGLRLLFEYPRLSAFAAAVGRAVSDLAPTVDGPAPVRLAPVDNSAMLASLTSALPDGELDALLRHVNPTRPEPRPGPPAGPSRGDISGG